MLQTILAATMLNLNTVFFEEIPVEDNSIDVVTSNCVINLSTEKEKVFKEIYRILKTGGRFVISDIVADKDVPDDIKKTRSFGASAFQAQLLRKSF